jgi:hypothetical protein
MASSLFPHDCPHKACGCVLFRAHDAIHAAAGVHQQRQRNRQIDLLGEVCELLLHAIFIDLEVIFGEIGHDVAMLAAHRGKHVDDGSLYLQRLRGLRHLIRRSLLAILSRCIGPGRRNKWAAHASLRRSPRVFSGPRGARQRPGEKCQSDYARSEATQSHCIILLSG